MGTNYYFVKGQHFPEHNDSHPLNGLLKYGTGRPPMIHVGKSSLGWCFSLRVYPTSGVHTLADWKNMAEKLLSEGWRIEDEYGEAHTPDELWREVERVDWNRPNLNRRDLENNHCIGHGEGLYDYVVGDFS